MPFKKDTTFVSAASYMSYQFVCRLSLSCLLLGCIVSLMACKPPASPRPGRADAVERYELKGKVVAVDAAKKRVTIAHDAIPDYMDAMTMPFAIRDEEMLGALSPGDTVTGVLIVENNVSWISVQSIVKSPEPIPGATPGLEVKKGDEAPDIELINQDGKKTNLYAKRGKFLLLTFIYTRCPLPDFCILMSENFGQISKVVASRPDLRKNVHLLSLSLDPAYDKPEVLQAYGKNYMSRFTKTDFTLWEFATGNDADIRRLAGFFGLTYMQENNQIVHSLRAVFIDREGKVAEVFKDNEWKPEDAIKMLEKLTGLSN